MKIGSSWLARGKWNNYSRKPSFCVVAISNAPYRLKVPVLGASSSISSYANISVAPRSVPKFIADLFLYVRTVHSRLVLTPQNRTSRTDRNCEIGQ